ncbi:uncharacterized protein ACIB01_008261 isoform 1-T2 [Guaruba guarouba]
MAPSSSIPHQARTRTAPLPISLLFGALTRYRLLPPRMAPASSPGLPRSHHPLRACPLPPRPPPHVYRPHGPGGDGRDPLQLRRRPSPASARPAGGPALRSATYPPRPRWTAPAVAGRAALPKLNKDGSPNLSSSWWPSNALSPVC